MEERRPTLVLQLVQVHEFAGFGVEAHGCLSLRLPALLLLLLAGSPRHFLLQLVQLAALCFKDEEKRSSDGSGGSCSGGARAQTADLRWPRPPSPETAAPAGWRRCSSTWAPNARKGLTSAPASAAPPPCERGQTEKETPGFAGRRPERREALGQRKLPPTCRGCCCSSRYSRSHFPFFESDVAVAPPFSEVEGRGGPWPAHFQMTWAAPPALSRPPRPSCLTLAQLAAVVERLPPQQTDPGPLRGEREQAECCSPQRNLSLE